MMNRDSSSSRFERAPVAVLRRLLLCVIVVATASPIVAAAAPAVAVREVEDYVFGNYIGDFKSPPNADLNPRRAIIVTFAGRAEKLVFWHEASYCPFFELSDGSGACYQF